MGFLEKSQIIQNLPLLQNSSFSSNYCQSGGFFDYFIGKNILENAKNQYTTIIFRRAKQQPSLYHPEWCFRQNAPIEFRLISSISRWKH